MVGLKGSNQKYVADTFGDSTNACFGLSKLARFYLATTLLGTTKYTILNDEKRKIGRQ